MSESLGLYAALEAARKLRAELPLLIQPSQQDRHLVVLLDELESVERMSALAWREVHRLEKELASKRSRP